MLALRGGMQSEEKAIETQVVTKYNLHFDKPHKITFIAYIYTCFNPNLDKKSCISTKIEVIKNVHIVSSPEPKAPGELIG